MAHALSGLNYTITVPTDVIEFIRQRRDDLQGTDHPDSLPIAAALQEVLRAEGYLPREIRLFSAWFIVALEGNVTEARDAQLEVEEWLGRIDFKKHW